MAEELRVKSLMKKKIIIIFLLQFLLIINIGAQEIQFTASVDKNVAALNQTLTLTIQLTSEGANISGMPQIPPLDGFTVVSGPNTSTKISFVNGKVSSGRSYSYVLVPIKEGKLTIGSAVFNHNNKEYKTVPIEIEVVKAAAPQQPQQNPPVPQEQQPAPDNQTLDLNKQIFLRVFLDKKNPYLNEGVTVTYKLYTRVQVRSYGISKPPTAAGTWIEEYPIPQQPVLETEIIDGINYQTAVIKKIELFPTKSGEITIDPLVLQTDILVRNRTGRNIFDSFFDDDFFGRTMRKEFAAPAFKLNVQPLPSEGKPSGFKNIVGDYSVKAEVDKTDVLTDEVVSLKVKISGSGNIKLIEAPDLKIPADFEIYDPKIEEKINKTGGNISGEKVFEYVLIPRIPGKQKIEPISFTYFNPKTKKYAALSTDEIIINVSPGKERLTAYPGNISRDEVRLLSSDIRFIKQKPIEWEKTDDRFYKDYIFFILIILPLGLLGATIIYNNHLERISTDVSYRRSRRAVKMAERRLKKSAEYLNEDLGEKFYSTLSSAMRGYIADKFNISEIGFLIDEVKEILGNSNVDEEITNKFFEIIKTCDYLRFAPSESDIEDMNKIYKDSKDVIVKLENVLSLKKNKKE